MAFFLMIKVVRIDLACSIEIVMIITIIYKEPVSFRENKIVPLES